MFVVLMSVTKSAICQTPSHYLFKRVVIEEEKQSVREAFLPIWNEDLLKSVDFAASGTWTGGGGTGVICTQEGTSAKALLDPKTGAIKREAYPLIRKAFMLDNRSQGVRYKVVRPGEEPLTYLTRVINEKYAHVNPDFAKDMIEAFELVNSLIYSDKHLPLPLAQDIGQLAENEKIILASQPHCTQAQIVIRYSLIKDGVIEKLFLDFDWKLLAVIRQSGDHFETTFNEALVILHEAVYLVALNSIDAKNTRDFVNFILSDEDNLHRLDEMISKLGLK